MSKRERDKIKPEGPAETEPRRKRRDPSSETAKRRIREEEGSKVEA